MALPSGIEGPTEFFEECIKFFKKYEHLFNFPNTDLLVNNVLDNIEVDNIDKADVYDVDFDLETVNCPYLTQFFESVNMLKVQHNEFKHEDNLGLLVDVPLSQKKRHEIIYLANEIKALCVDINCDTVVDFGSGLGYLDQQLFEITNYNILGLECNEGHYVGAKQRQRKYHIKSLNHVKYVRHTITEDSHSNIKDYIEDKFPRSSSFCIAGLHACADLTIEAINIFLNMENACALIIMPCCYHRLKTESKLNKRFKNFPISSNLMNVYEKYNGFNYLTVPFLRLATQPPKIKTDKLEDIVFNLMARAVIQLYGRKHNCTVKRNKRKAVHLKSMDNDFKVYIQDAVKGFNLSEINEVSNIKQVFDIDELLSMWNQIPQIMFKKAAVFILLQNILQPMCENFILYDRLVYLQENGVENCKFKRIINENISPRCLALFARK